jgi:hypothetical protein
MTDHPLDAGHVLALCEASADAPATAAVRRIIDDGSLAADVKAAFFGELRAALEDPAARHLSPWTVIRRFMDGAGRKYIARGEEMGPPLPTDATGFLREVLASALRDGVSRVLIVPSGTALYRGAELVGVVAPDPDLFAQLYQYCCAVAGLAEGTREAACTVGADGTLGPAAMAGHTARLQIVSNGRVSGLQLLF